MDDERQPIRVLIADQHALFRDTLRRVLESEARMHVVASARDAREAVAEAGRTRSQLAIVDADLPPTPAARTTAMIKERVPECQVLVLDGNADLRVLADVLEAGASGYLTRDAPVAELIHAAESIGKGEMLIPPKMLKPLLTTVFERKREGDQAAARIAKLTGREREVLGLLASGAGNELIARTLLISPQTARTHVQNILGKIGLHSRLEAIAFVTQHGMLRDLVGSDA